MASEVWKALEDARMDNRELKRGLRDRLREAEEKAIRLQWDLDTANATILELSGKTADPEAERDLLAECEQIVEDFAWSLGDGPIRAERLRGLVARYRAAKGRV